MKILIAVPCFNEESDISSCINNLKLAIKSFNKEFEYEIAIFDDGSYDQTNSIVSTFKNITYIKTKQNYGLAKVFNNIIYYAKSLNFDHLLVFDADNQYPYKEIPMILNEALENNADITLGIRNFQKSEVFSKFKSFLQIFGSFTISLLLGMKILDATTGFRVYSSKAIENLYVTNSFSYTIETLFAAKSKNLKIHQYPLQTFYKTRNSRLFKSNSEYLYKTFKILESSILLYKRNILFRIYVISVIPGVILVSRFIYNYFIFDGYDGNVQSLQVGLSIVLLATIFYTMLLNISFMKKNMMEVLKTTFKANYEIIKL